MACSFLIAVFDTKIEPRERCHIGNYSSEKWNFLATLVFGKLTQEALRLCIPER